MKTYTQYKDILDIIKYQTNSYEVVDKLYELNSDMLDTIKESEMSTTNVNDSKKNLLLEDKEKKQIEQNILKKTRGVFKYVTSCQSTWYTSSKNRFVQVGYLDVEDNIVFNHADTFYIEDKNTLVRYLPGFYVRGYNSCEQYIPVRNSKNEDVINNNKEIREVISSTSIKYSCSHNSSDGTIYSVIGYLDDDNELVYYNQVVDND